MKKFLCAAFAASVFLPISANAEQITLQTSADLEWERTPEGVEFASLQGDRFSEAYQAFVKLPAGTVSPAHIKSANMYGIMLQGEMIHYSALENPETARKIGKGAFYSIPNGLAHVSACVSDIPCIAYLYQDGPFDFRPVK